MEKPKITSQEIIEVIDAREKEIFSLNLDNEVDLVQYRKIRGEYKNVAFERAVEIYNLLENFEAKQRFCASALKEISDIVDGRSLFASYYGRHINHITGCEIYLEALRAILYATKFENKDFISVSEMLKPAIVKYEIYDECEAMENMQELLWQIYNPESEGADVERANISSDEVFDNLKSRYELVTNMFNEYVANGVYDAKEPIEYDAYKYKETRAIKYEYKKVAFDSAAEIYNNLTQVSSKNNFEKLASILMRNINSSFNYDNKHILCEGEWILEMLRVMLKAMQEGKDIDHVKKLLYSVLDKNDSLAQNVLSTLSEYYNLEKKKIFE